MIRILLWDIDGTLLDFKAAERAAIKSLFDEFSLGTCSDDMVRRYSEINDGFWRRLEQHEVTRQQVLVGRFEQFFTEIGVSPALAPEFNQKYQLRLGDTIVYRDDSLQIIKSLQGRVRQYAVSNGTVVAQSKKLRLSGLGVLMDGIFLSEKIGAEKPSPLFFDAVFEAIRPSELSEVMIVGDSLTSDMQGGVNAGILTCWYNPERKPAPAGLRIDHTISDLHEILMLVETE